MSLSVIIVNYRSATHIINCIQSVIVHDSAKDFEWVVVDNDSKDGSKETILASFPFVQWIDMGYNAGFARANNEGIRQSNGNTVLLLNPDIIFQDNTLSRCYKNFCDSEYIACGVQLLNPDYTHQIS